MNNGAIEQKGTFNELQALGLDFMKLLKATESASKEADVGQSENRRRSSVRCETKSDGEDSNVSPVEMREIAAKGRLSGDVFFAYFKASKKPFMIALMILIFLMNQIVSGGSDYFVAFWVNVESKSKWREIDNSTKEFLWDGPLSRDSIIYIYSAMIVGIIVLWQLQTIVYFTICMWSSVNLHSDMFRSILRTTMYFYNINPAGRILNR